MLECFFACDGIALIRTGIGMPTIIFDDASVSNPGWVQDRLSFRRWLNSDDFPETGRICYFGGVWADMSKGTALLA